MLWLYLALTLLTWGLWGVLPKLAVTRLDPNSALFFQSLGGVVAGLIGLALARFRPQVEAGGVSYAMLAGFMGILGALFFLRALTLGNMVQVVGISSLYPVVTVLLAAAFFGETVTPQQWLGLGCAVAAHYFLAT